jgi:hypothetical protein
VTPDDDQRDEVIVVRDGVIVVTHPVLEDEP